MPVTCSVFFLFLSWPSPPECQTGEVGTLLLANPVGQNVLDFPRLFSEAAKVFGLRGRRLKLYLDQDFTQGNSTMPQHLTILQFAQLRTAAKGR